jgi:hypothetical protein
MYVAAVLSEESVKLLRSIIEENLKLTDFQFETSRGDPLPHHFTINLGSFDEGLNAREILGKPATLRFDQISYDKTLGVCAIPVSAEVIISDSKRVSLHTSNEFPHVTCCITPKSKPMLSNEMFEKTKHFTLLLPKHYILEAIVAECQ